jgi:hypothetical protein
MSPGGLDVVAEFEIRRPGPDVLLQSLQCQAEIRHDREERNKWAEMGDSYREQFNKRRPQSVVSRQE